MADGGQHPAHLPVAALVDGQLHLPDPAPAHILLATQQPNILGGSGQAIIKHDPLPKTRQRVGVRDALHLRPISFRDMVTWVGQLEQKVAVIRKEDQPLAVGVQSAHGPQHRLPADVY